MAQYVLRRDGRWTGRLFVKFPKVCEVRVAATSCHARTLALVMTDVIHADDRALTGGEAAESRVLEFAGRCCEPRHAAVLWGCVIKHLVASGCLGDALARATEVVGLLQADLAEPAQGRAPGVTETLLAQGFLPAVEVVDRMCADVASLTQVKQLRVAFDFVALMTDRAMQARSLRTLLCCLGPREIGAAPVSVLQVDVARMFFSSDDAVIDMSVELFAGRQVPRDFLNGPSRAPAEILIAFHEQVFMTHLCGAAAHTRPHNIAQLLGVMPGPFRGGPAGCIWRQMTASLGLLGGWDSLAPEAAAVARVLQAIPLLMKPDVMQAALEDMVQLLVDGGHLHLVVSAGGAPALPASKEEVDVRAALWAATRTAYRLDALATPGHRSGLSLETLGLLRQLAPRLAGDTAVAAYAVWCHGMVWRGAAGRTLALDTVEALGLAPELRETVCRSLCHALVDQRESAAADQPSRSPDYATALMRGISVLVAATTTTTVEGLQQPLLGFSPCVAVAAADPDGGPGPSLWQTVCDSVCSRGDEDADVLGHLVEFVQTPPFSDGANTYYVQQLCLSTLRATPDGDRRLFTFFSQSWRDSTVAQWHRVVHLCAASDTVSAEKVASVRRMINASAQGLAHGRHPPAPSDCGDMA